METKPLENFATWARKDLITQVTARLGAVLGPGSTERVEHPGAVSALEREIDAEGGGAEGRKAVIDKGA